MTVETGTNPGRTGNGEHKKVAVIGGGPGGYVAAIRAAQLGARMSPSSRRAPRAASVSTWGCNSPPGAPPHGGSLYAAKEGPSRVPG